ncbi:MAG: sigma-70 family RNA polymerase sigma factor [Flavobacteriales bacterium]|tara:strand:- start:3588 stop:4175 length:588 start_codon:yes stop_codon:yes gene_type:complete
MDYSKCTDQELVVLYISGKDLAFEQLIARHKNRVYTKIYLMVKDREITEDIFQDCFIKVINTLRKGKYNDEGKFLPWVLRIAHNLVIDYFRKGKKMPTVRSDENYDVFSTIKHDDLHIEDQIVKDQIMGDVKKLIKELPQEQKEVVLMRIYYKMSFKEISVTLDISINTALGRMRYALINLRKIVDEKNINLLVN